MPIRPAIAAITVNNAMYQSLRDGATRRFSFAE
jgi:hypothetical protein